MTDIFGTDDLRATARRNPAEGPPSSFSESLRSSWEVTAATGMSLSAGAQLRARYGSYLDEVEAITGQRFNNPMDLPATPDDFIVRQPDPRLRSSAPPAQARPKTSAEREAELFATLDGLRAKHPELAILSPEQIRAQIGEARDAVREKRAGVARREFGLAANAGAFLGASGAILVDPPVLASMAFGAPWATGLLRAAVIEAGAAGTGELFAQAGIQTSRQQFGEQADLGEAATAVAIAAGGAGVLAPVLRGGAAGVRALLKRAEALPAKNTLTRAAERYLRRQVELEDASPFRADPAARAEHVERMSEAQVALREGRQPDMPEQPRSALREQSPDNLGGGGASPAAGMRGGALPDVGAQAQPVPPSPAAPPPHSTPADPVTQIGATVRQEAMDRLVLGDRERAAIEAVAPLLDDPDALAALYRALRAKPAKVETLTQFLKRLGGIREDRGALRALGLPRAMPGLLRKGGAPLDDATHAAWEAGFFPQHATRPVTDDLLGAIQAEIAGHKILRLEDEAAMAERDALAALDEGLVSAGVDVRKLKAGEFAPRLRDVQQAIAERARGAEATRMAQAGADAADVEERLSMMADTEDAVAEADMRTRYQGREAETILIEDDDGVRRVTVAQMFEGFERDANDLAALRACAGGGR